MPALTLQNSTGLKDSLFAAVAERPISRNIAAPNALSAGESEWTRTMIRIHSCRLGRLRRFAT